MLPEPGHTDGLIAITSHVRDESAGSWPSVGVSAVFYLTLEAEELGLPETVMDARIMVVVASTVAHGVTSSAGRLL